MQPSAPMVTSVSRRRGQRGFLASSVASVEVPGFVPVVAGPARRPVSADANVRSSGKRRASGRYDGFRFPVSACARNPIRTGHRPTRRSSRTAELERWASQRTIRNRQRGTSKYLIFLETTIIKSISYRS